MLKLLYSLKKLRGECKVDPTRWPNADHIKIWDYLMESPCTKESLKAEVTRNMASVKFTCVSFSNEQIITSLFLQTGPKSNTRGKEQI